jgi:ATP-dependent DNA ligase
MAQIVPAPHDNAVYHFSRTERLVRTLPFAVRPPPTLTDLGLTVERLRFFGEYHYGTQRAKAEVDGVYGHTTLYDVHDVDGALDALPYAERRKLLFQMFGANPTWAEHFAVAEEMPYAWARSLVVRDDLEGLVFRDGTGTLYRQKRVEEEDYICVGFVPFKTGPRKGQGCGSIVGGKIDATGTVVPVTTMGGIEDDLRNAIVANPQMFVGRVFTAKGKGRFQSGLLRHPSFDRWRDDKSADDCTMTENG